MSYGIERDEEKRVIRVKVSCVINQETRLKILMSVSNQLAMTGYSKVLLDMTESMINPEEPVSNAHDMVKFMIKVGFKPTLKMAFVYSDSEVHRGYFEAICNMQGLNIRYFKSFDEACEWLG